MALTFVGRAEQLEILRRRVSGRVRGPVIITGEPGMGRTTVLSRALDFVDDQRDSVVRLRSSSDVPFAALRGSFAVPARATASEAVAAITQSAGGRRLVVAADDAHLMDPPSLLALREVSRADRALLLVTCPLLPGPCRKPDPTDCLLYEREVHTMTLRPLGVGEIAALLTSLMGGPVALATAEAVRAATRGRPRELQALVTTLPACMVRRQDLWQLGAVEVDPPVEAASTGVDEARVCEAAWSAWKELACERADQLCRLALRLGVREPIAPIWATLLLLYGRPAQAADFLDSLPSDRVVATPQLSLAKALVLAVGLGCVEEANRFLAQAADRADSRPQIQAYRAWICAVTGRSTEASEGLRAFSRDDLLETAMFVHATRAVLARLGGRPGEAVFHFRRALATAEAGSAECPWMRPLLKGLLIDSMLLSGREQDATSAARLFHARERGSGWELAVALENLLGPAVGSAGPVAETASTLHRYDVSWLARHPGLAQVPAARNHIGSLS
jgi:hypothetical protein